MQNHPQQPPKEQTPTRRTPPPNPNLRRRLFQDTQQHQTNHVVEQEEDQNQLDRLMEAARVDNAWNLAAQLLNTERDEKKRKWNFDFETETPLEGQWEWEAVEQPGAENRGTRNDGYCDSRKTNGSG